MPSLSQSGKVLALAGTRDVFQAATDTKEHLCASSTAGDVIPPMHIFSAQRFQHKPLEDGINGAGYLRSLRFKIPTIVICFVICFVQQVHVYIQLISLNEATLKRQGSQTMEKLAVRYQEGYDLKTYRFGLN